MDSRQSQPPPSFTRSQDRPPVSHATHTPSAPPSHTPYFRPSSSKTQPMQIPFSDPFRSRPADPFLPSPQSQRRGSYGLPSGRDGPQPSGLSHASRESSASAWPVTSGSSSSIPHSLHGSPSRSHVPPNIPTSSSNSSYGYDLVRRNSVGPSSSPQFYPAPLQEQSSTANFGPRQMPPPSPSQQPSSLASYASQRPPPPPLPYSSRELPSLGSSSRQGTGMSISSILGADAPSQPPRAQQPSATPPNVAHMRPPSPRISHMGGPRADRPQWARPETPEKPSAPPSSMRVLEAPNYSSNSSPRYYNPGTRESPDFNSNPPLPQYHMHPTPPRNHIFQASPRDTQDHRHLDDRMPPRPASQPAPYGLPRSADYHESPAAPRPPPFGGNIMQRNTSQESASGPPSQYLERPGINLHERPGSSQPVGASSYQTSGRPNDETNLMRRNLLSQEPVREESRRDFGTPKKEEHNGPPRTGFRGQYYSQPPTSIPVTEAPRSHPHVFDPARRPPEQFISEPGQGYNRQLYDHDRRSESIPMQPDSRISDSIARHQGGEPMQQSRSFLGISDPHKRGRASPLPQAVKGAQAQLVGPGSDPSIKSEFGRIFQGLGSGLGGPGSLTPSRQSPVPQRMRDDLASGDGDGVKMARVGSRGPRGKRPRDEENEQGRVTPLGSGGRGGKRKQALHQSNSQRQADDESPTSSRLFNSIVPIQHQEDISLRQMPPQPPIPKPTLTVSSESVLNGVSDKERHHLGSGLYDVIFMNPPFASTPMMDKWGYCMQYKPTRRFTWADENCTFTVRVPREYLSDDMREKLCVDRYLYGTEIFTEDSDPILAAIHSGWIRGAWPSDVDTSLMDLPSPPPDGESAIMELSQPPASGPAVPPHNMDCHITLLILPALVKYSPSLRFGVKSRPWGDNHDGISFMVIGVKWVDEGMNRKVERTGKGRREKLALDIATTTIGAPEGKKRKLNGSTEVDGMDAMGSKFVKAAA